MTHSLYTMRAGKAAGEAGMKVFGPEANGVSTAVLVAVLVYWV